MDKLFLTRKPDIKWKKNKKDLKEIVEIQEKILETCSKYLKKGGEMVYSTCSILEEENEKVMEKFLEKNKNFELVKIDNLKNTFFENYLQNEGYIRVIPNEKTDGFFICKIVSK